MGTAFSFFNVLLSQVGKNKNIKKRKNLKKEEVSHLNLDDLLGYFAFSVFHFH